MSALPMEIQRVARELTTTLTPKRTVHARINPRMRRPARGYLVPGVTPSQYVHMGQGAAVNSLYEAACGYVEQYWLRASAIPGKRMFQLRYTPIGAFLAVVEYCNTLKEAAEMARRNGEQYVWDVQGERYISLTSLLSVPTLR